MDVESIARSKKASILFCSVLFCSVLFCGARLGYFLNQDNMNFLNRKMCAAVALGAAFLFLSFFLKFLKFFRISFAGMLKKVTWCMTAFCTGRCRRIKNLCIRCLCRLTVIYNLKIIFGGVYETY